MSGVVLAGGTPDLAARLQAVHPQVEVLPPGRLPTEPLRLFELLHGDLPEVVVLGPAAPLADILELAGRLDAAWHGVAVVLAAAPPAAALPDLMRAGVRELVAPDAEAAELAAAVGRAGEAALARRQALRPVTAGPTAPGRVVAVVSPKGGVGKTTVATNLAVGLAAAAPQSTVVVDLDVQFGDVATALGLAPEYTLPDAVSARASEDSMVLKTFLTQHASGLFAVCGSDSPAAGDAVTGEDVSRLLASMARQFRYVVVDTAPGLSDQTLAAIDRATDVVLLSSMDVPGVRGLRKEIDVLTEFGLMPAGRHVVLNLAEPKSGLARADVERALGTPVDVVLPRSATVPASTNAGVPLLLGDARRDPATREMRRLLERFVPAPVVPRGRGWTRQRKAS
ncbi:AAA family ATPase [Blastococcus saxobsidens]|uniref:Pilus assembly protein ATPase n=1 Tax=Blastococcus saxobsidens (strain DD2) TaxID=1146883 RepID=H6RRU1_BLASD|nr:AAA family ATPase [Blastococcus saxobsidens]CCG02935.1 Pilus assembly protein ATPase [Blastococcus saxobsidens DD2]